MSIEDEEILIAEVLSMKEHGFETSRSGVLPNLWVRRYGQMYRENCGGCVRDAYDNLIKWATKKKSTKNQHSMSAYKFKREYWNKTVPILYRGQRLIITADNLTDERAQIILAIPKYAHILESVDGVNVTTHVISANKTVKQEPDKIIAPKLITSEFQMEPDFPNETLVKESKDSTSTSKEVKKEVTKPKGKRGRPFSKSKG